MSNGLANVPATMSLVNVIADAASNPDVDVTKLEALVRLQQEVMHEEAKRQFNTAMARVQGQMAQVRRDAVNTHTNSRYATMGMMDAPLRSIYTEEGIAVRFGSEPSPREGAIRVTATVTHSAGYSEQHFLDVPLDMAGSRGSTNKTQVQAVGSSVTYARRYLLMMVFNIVLEDDPDDDDGEATRSAPPPRGRPQPRAEAEQPPGNERVESWLRGIEAALTRAQLPEDVVLIRKRAEVQDALQRAPNAVRQRIEAMLRTAADRVASQPRPNGAASADAPPADANGQGWADPVSPLIAEIEKMDLASLQTLTTNPPQAWRDRTHDLFPPDLDYVNEAIIGRIALLRQEAPA